MTFELRLEEEANWGKSIPGKDPEAGTRLRGRREDRVAEAQRVRRGRRNSLKYLAKKMNEGEAPPSPGGVDPGWRAGSLSAGVGGARGWPTPGGGAVPGAPSGGGAADAPPSLGSSRRRQPPRQQASGGPARP